MASTILDELIEKNNIKYVQIKVRIPEELAKKIKEICETVGAKDEEYIAKLLEASEIAKVHKSLKL